MTGARAWQLVRWGLTALILVWAAARLRSAWASLESPPLAVAPGPLAESALLGAAAMAVLAVTSAAGARAAGLGAGGWPFWRGWLRVWFQGYFYRYVPGKVALVIERARLAERLGVPRAASVVLVVWESLLLLAGAGLLGAIALLALPTAGPVSGASVAALAAASLAGSLALGPSLGALARRWPALAARVPGFAVAVPPGRQLGLVAGNALAWALLGASFAACARALGADGQVPAAALVTWFVASYVGGQVASATPAGLGVREGLLVAGLAGSAPAPAVLGWAVGHRVVLSLVELALVGLAVAIPLPTADPAD